MTVPSSVSSTCAGARPLACTRSRAHRRLSVVDIRRGPRDKAFDITLPVEDDRGGQRDRRACVEEQLRQAVLAVQRGFIKRRQADGVLGSEAGAQRDQFGYR